MSVPLLPPSAHPSVFPCLLVSHTLPPPSPQGLASWHYFPPGSDPKMRHPVLRRDFFDSEDAVIDHVRLSGLERPAPVGTVVSFVRVYVVFLVKAVFCCKLTSLVGKFTWISDQDSRQVTVNRGFPILKTILPKYFFFHICRTCSPSAKRFAEIRAKFAVCFSPSQHGDWRLCCVAASLFRSTLSVWCVLYQPLPALDFSLTFSVLSLDCRRASTTARPRRNVCGVCGVCGRQQ